MLSFGQLVTFDAALNSLLAGTWVEQAAYYGQMIANELEQAVHLAQQVEYTVKSYEMAAKNLASIGDIRSWDDFKDWHNRQLYLERKTEEAFSNMNVTIGKKNYSIFDIEGITGGLDDTYVKFWENEFTEDQRREMWVGLGLTPANYAYVQTWQTREQELTRQALAGTAVQNEQYMESMEKTNDILNTLATDVGVGELGDKEMQAMQIKLLAQANKTLNDLIMAIALQNEMIAVEKRLEQTPADAPLLSEFPEDGFGALDSWR